MVSLSAWEDRELKRIHCLLLKPYENTKQDFRILHFIGDMIQVLLQPIQPLVLLCCIPIVTDRLSDHESIRSVKTGEV